MVSKTKKKHLPEMSSGNKLKGNIKKYTTKFEDAAITIMSTLNNQDVKNSGKTRN